MIAYYPRLRDGAASGLVPKLGGLPHGLPARLWPVCRECGRPMSHLAQVPDAPPAQPVGDGRVLFLFKCERADSVCSFWGHGTGANAAFAVDRADLDDVATPAPADAGAGTPVLSEIGIAGWDARDDGAPAAFEDAFYDFDAFAALPDQIAMPQGGASESRTKSGGVPAWTVNGAQCIDGFPAGRLLLQIDSWATLDDSSVVEVANFCSDGTAYVFVDRASSPSRFSMFINR